MKTSTFIQTALVSAAALALLTACGGSPAAGGDQSASAESATLRISAAASLKGAFTPLIEGFVAQNPDVTVEPVNFDGSSTLVEQIIGGDAVDVFASADEKNMDRLAEAEMVEGDPVIFASNAITLAVPESNPGQISSFSDITNPDLSIAVCAPEVPCGASTEKLLEQEGTEIVPVTFEQNVSAVAAKISAEEVDAGFIYQTDVQGSDGLITAVETPAVALNLYPAAVVKGSDSEKAAKLFVDYLLSEEGQTILRDYGFGTP